MNEFRTQPATHRSTLTRLPNSSLNPQDPSTQTLVARRNLRLTRILAFAQPRARSATNSLPSACSLPIAPFTLSKVNMVVMAAGTARIRFVPMPL